ncbi:hypothetical protein [Buttiauxella noackiae]|uniref:hypothetical protein n=1 Tax=Buttiauxella noackiae TaxID=82992 RepID=UPI00054E1B00|nr:hypothetical protein [Buttiauxella noackiae]
MIQSTLNNTQIRVNPGDWKNTEPGLLYMGKYQVGRFKMGNNFMIQYMKLIHHTSIVIGHEQDNTTNEYVVMYMQHHGIIDNSILMQMREMVKNPKVGFSVFQRNNVVTAIYRDMNNE